jgi:hypothetical protein
MKSSNSRRRPRLVAWVTNLAVVVALAALPGAALAGEYPKAEKILDQFVKASGGKKAYDKIENRISEVTFSIPAAGISAPMMIYAARPNKVYTVLESEALGKIENGTDGETVWEISTMSGPAVKEGDERQEVLKNATFDRTVYWRDNFKSVETVGVDEVDGRSCYRVEQTPNWGSVETYCYDAETHLVSKVELTVVTQMGAIPMVMYPSDYREVDGIMVSYKATMEVMQQERIITTDSVKHNVEMTADRFALPAEIAELVTETE